MKEKKGISLILTVITIIIMIIIAGAVILTLTNTNILAQADTATKKHNKQQYKQIIGTEYVILRTSEEAKGKTTVEIFKMLEEKMNMQELSWISLSNKAYIEINNEYILALYEDGSIKEEEIKVLDIANGTIQLKKNGYVQGTNKLEEYAGDYIITGTTTENTVKVMEEGTYDIIIKDLNIDVMKIERSCAFYANAGNKKTDCFVNIYIEGDNTLRGTCGLGFPNATPNVDGVTNGSTLTIQGNGNLYAEGGNYSAGIGTGYGYWSAANGDANNIIINSGNIIARGGKSYATGIGSSLYKNANNIIINGGDITASSPYGCGIGANGKKGESGILNNVQINGGVIRATGGEYGGAIGADAGSGEIQINGGVIYLNNSHKSQRTYSLLGTSCKSIQITGGTIIGDLKNEMAMGTTDITENINITGGSIYMDRADNLYAVPPISGEKKGYLTQIQLQNVSEEVQVTSLVTSDNLTYGIKDMYTANEGKLYLYLPTGEREITIKAGNKDYIGTVTTGEADSTEVVVLNVK